MTAMFLEPAARLADGALGDERAHAAAAAKAPVAPADHDGWACGLGDSPDPGLGDRCRTMMPELIVELL